MSLRSSAPTSYPKPWFTPATCSCVAIPIAPRPTKSPDGTALSSVLSRRGGATPVSRSTPPGGRTGWVPSMRATRNELLERQYERWRAVDIEVDRVWLGDPMGWNLPWDVASQLRVIRRRWPTITRFHLHLHRRAARHGPAVGLSGTLDLGTRVHARPRHLDWRNGGLPVRRSCRSDDAHDRTPKTWSKCSVARRAVSRRG